MPGADHLPIGRGPEMIMRPCLDDVLECFPHVRPVSGVYAGTGLDDITFDIGKHSESTGTASDHSVRIKTFLEASHLLSTLKRKHTGLHLHYRVAARARPFGGGHPDSAYVARAWCYAHRLLSAYM